MSERTWINVGEMLVAADAIDAIVSDEWGHEWQVWTRGGQSMKVNAEQAKDVREVLLNLRGKP